MSASRDIFQSCVHRKCGMHGAITYCCFLAIAFVAALYAFVPRAVRVLPRDHPTQIQFRSLACLIVCAGGMFTYPFLFCGANEDGQANEAIFSIGRILLLPSRSTGFFFGTFGILLHSCTLYAGSWISSFLLCYEIWKRSIRQGRNESPIEYLRRYFRHRLLPSSNREHWIAIRNCCIAPLTEEIVFRGCMVPPLLATGMPMNKVALVAPLFFGVAHLHHAATRLSNGDPPRLVALATIFQFLYTTLFGYYASYAFIRAGSVLPVVISHSFCNWMGLPDLAFVSNSDHPLRQHKGIILLSYAIGIFAFWYMFRLDLFLPLSPRLPPLVIPE